MVFHYLLCLFPILLIPKMTLSLRAPLLKKTDYRVQLVPNPKTCFSKCTFSEHPWTKKLEISALNNGQLQRLSWFTKPNQNTTHIYTIRVKVTLQFILLTRVFLKVKGNAINSDTKTKDKNQDVWSKEVPVLCRTFENLASFSAAFNLGVH